MSVPGKNPEADWQAAVDAGLAVMRTGNFDEGQARFRTALALAEKLQPRDWRFIRTIGQLAGMYQNGQKFAEAAAEYQRQLAVTAEVYGAESPENADPLMGGISAASHPYLWKAYLGSDEKARPSGAWTGHPRELGWRLALRNGGMVRYVYFAADWICE
jgi:hypothetical protein